MGNAACILSCDNLGSQGLVYQRLLSVKVRIVALTSMVLSIERAQSYSCGSFEHTRAVFFDLDCVVSSTDYLGSGRRTFKRQDFNLLCRLP